jgi:hypothetical protein
MKRSVLAGITLLALVTVGCAGPVAPPIGYKASPPLLYKAKPRSVSAPGSKNDALFREFLDWRKKQSQ